MKRLALLCFLFLMGARRGDHPDGSLLTNSGFESPPVSKGASEPELPKYWRPFSGDTARNIKLTRTLAGGGQQSLRLESMGDANSFQGICQSIAATPAQDFVFSVALRVEPAMALAGTVHIQISIEWQDGGQEIDRKLGPEITAGAAADIWTTLKMTGIAPEGCNSANFVITMFDDVKPRGGACYVDNAVVVEPH